MITEKWDILDENGTPTGKTAFRGRQFLKSGEFHLVVHIWIFSPDGKILIQRRSETKPLMPGEWAATGGAAISGENSFAAASRELAEELGIFSTKKTLKKAFRIKRRNSLLDVWLICTDISVDNLTLQESEVAEAKWVSLDELKEMIISGNFHNYGNEYFKRVFEKIEENRKVAYYKK
ncbi:MAG: NUDIX domain-containing protein [Clostridia bacterium]|nr:NUDIX domain-containing protein [Clostridia bacterium]